MANYARHRGSFLAPERLGLEQNFIANGPGMRNAERITEFELVVRAADFAVPRHTQLAGAVAELGSGGAKRRRQSLRHYRRAEDNERRGKRHLPPPDRYPVDAKQLRTGPPKKQRNKKSLSLGPLDDDEEVLLQILRGPFKATSHPLICSLTPAFCRGLLLLCVCFFSFFYRKISVHSRWLSAAPRTPSSTRSGPFCQQLNTCSGGSLKKINKIPKKSCSSRVSSLATCSKFSLIFFFVPKVADIAGIAFFVRRSRK